MMRERNGGGSAAIRRLKISREKEGILWFVEKAKNMIG